jgi:hypothetical protein
VGRRPRRGGREVVLDRQLERFSYQHRRATKLALGILERDLETRLAGKAAEVLRRRRSVNLDDVLFDGVGT